MKRSFTIVFFMTCLFASVLYSCTVISPFSQPAYDTTLSIRARAAAIMDSATESYSSHQVTATRVLASVNQAYQAEKMRPKNKLTVAMWAKMKDTSGHLFGGFVHRWQMKDTLNPLFVYNAAPLVDSAFSQILELEKAKPVKK